MQTMSPHPAVQQAAFAKARSCATFSRLMELYEKNYILLKLLFDDYDPCTGMAVRYSDKRYRLELAPLEHERYTTTVLLTYSLLDHRRRTLTRIVQLRIRIYRDTRQAELFRPAEYLSKDTATERNTDGAIVMRWILNNFLNKLLGAILPLRYCPAVLSHKPRVV